MQDKNVSTAKKSTRGKCLSSSSSSANHLPAPRVRAIRAWSTTAIVVLFFILRREPAPVPRPFEARHHRRIARARIRIPLPNAASKVARIVSVAVIRSRGRLVPSSLLLPGSSSGNGEGGGGGQR